MTVNWNKPVQVYHGDKWRDVVSVTVGKLNAGYAAIVWYAEHDCICADTYSNESKLIRNTPAPPKLVPFTEDTFPSGCVWMRCKGSNERHLVTCVTAFGVFRGTSLTRWNELMSDYEISVYGAGTWLPCGVTEVQK